MNAIVFILQILERCAGQTIYGDCSRALMMYRTSVIGVHAMPGQLFPFSLQIIILGDKTPQTVKQRSDLTLTKHLFG